MATPRIDVRTPAALLAAARKALGVGPEACDSDIVRRALAHAAGADVQDFPLDRPGPKPRAREQVA